MHNSITLDTSNLFLLDGLELRTLLFIKAYDGYDSPSVEYLMDKTGKSRTVIFRHLKKLKEKGFLRKDEHFSDMRKVDYILKGI